MILLDAFISFFAIFISPQIFLYYKYPNLNYSLILIYGLIVSFTGSWIVFLTIFYLDLPNIIAYLSAIFIFISSLTYMYLNKENAINKKYSLLIWIIVIIALFPLLKNIGVGFTAWDTVASWNNWAIELFNNEYEPIDAAYPVLMPAIWSLIYKIQGNHDIWWTAQITLFVVPLMVLVVLLTLYNETKNKSFIVMAILIYPYLLSGAIIDGYMDMPVMIMGFLSLVILYAAELNKDKAQFEYYIYASLLLAGIASITKQAGLAFIVFDLAYIMLNIKLFTQKKRLLFITVSTFLYFITYLSIYYLNTADSITANFNHLGSLSEGRYEKYNLQEYLKWLYDNFFALPDSMRAFSTKHSTDILMLFTPFLIILGFILFIFKNLRNYHSVAFISSIFFILGALTWIKFFSYDPRNSYWVKSFFIVFFAINFNYLLMRYKHKRIYTKLLFTGIILAISYYLISLGDEFAYEKQKKSQSKVGNVRLAKYAATLLKGKAPCVKLYTNELPIPHNYHLKQYRDNGQVITIGRDYKFKDFKYLENICHEGSYILFRILSPLHPDEWWKVEKLTKAGLIKPIQHEKDLVYFVPPGIKIPDRYFDRRVDRVNITLKNYQSNIKYSLDKYIVQNDIDIISGWAFIENEKIDKTEKYILLKNEEHEYIITANTISRRDVTQHFKAQDLDQSGFISYIYKDDFPKGVYDIHLLLIEDEKQYLVPIDKKIHINGE